MSWKTVCIADIASEDRQIIAPESDAATKLHYLGMEQIEPGTGRILTYQGNPSEGRSTTFAFDKRHVLYGKLRPYLNKVAIPDCEGRCSTEIIPLLPKGVDREFLSLVLRSDRLIAAAMADKTGSRMPRADMDALMAVEIEIPEAPEQQRQIATRLKAQLAEVETARKAAQTQAEDISLLRSRLIAETFAAIDTKPTPLGDVIQSIQAGKSFQTAEVLAKPSELGVLKVSAVSWSRFQPNEAKALKDDYEPEEHHRVCKDDFIISRANTRELVGAVVLVDESHPYRLLSDKTLRLVIDEQKACKAYLLYALRAPMARKHIEHFATGTSDSMRNISQGTITSIPIALPKLEVQIHIAKRLKKQLAAIEAMQNANQSTLDELSTLPQRLLAQAFNHREET